MAAKKKSKLNNNPTDIAAATQTAIQELPEFNLYVRANTDDAAIVGTILDYITRKEAQGWRVVLHLNSGNDTEAHLRNCIMNNWAGDVIYKDYRPNWYPQKGQPMNRAAGRERDEKVVAAMAAFPEGHRGAIIFGEVILEDQYSRDWHGDAMCYCLLKNAGVPVVGVHGDPKTKKLVYYANSVAKK